jgi:hypothetical protein
MLVQKYINQGFDPLYCKFDIEGSDLDGVKSLVEAGIFPEFISAELHDFRVLSALTRNSNYGCFRLEVAGSAAKKLKKYRNYNFNRESC